MRKISTPVVIMVMLTLIVFMALIVSAEEKKCVRIIKNNVNIRMGSSTSYVIVGQAKENDIFELEGEQGQWFKIIMFSGEWRYVHKSLAEPVYYHVSLPPVSIQETLIERLGQAEDRAMAEADMLYPLNTPEDVQKNMQKNIEYERLLEDRYKLIIFHEFNVQPAIYTELLAAYWKRLRGQ